MPLRQRGAEGPSGGEPAVRPGLRPAVHCARVPPGPGQAPSAASPVANTPAKAAPTAEDDAEAASLALYRNAHRLHFVEHDYAGALGAWDEYLRESAGGHGLHSARALVRELDERFERVQFERGAYLFPELDGTTEAEELDAIASGAVQPLRIDYVGRLSRRSPR